VPQLRKRVVAIGGLGWDPSFPDFTHTAFGAPGAQLASSHLPLTSTVREVLHDLPPARNTEHGFPQGHFYQPLQGLDLIRAELLKPGQTMRDLPEHLQHQSYQRRSMRRVQDGTATEKRGGPPSGIRRLVGDQPSKAITGGARNEFLHHIENRGLTIRECARLQTFEDNFEFLGTLSEQAQLIGNAVPPRLAYVLAKSLASDLEKRQTQAKPDAQGALLSFMPTLADGYSPILRQLIDRVNTRFYSKRETMELAL
jgi:DNA (cytosine-5)-methyltransferase 1